MLKLDLVEHLPERFPWFKPSTLLGWILLYLFLIVPITIAISAYFKLSIYLLITLGIVAVLLLVLYFLSNFKYLIFSRNNFIKTGTIHLAASFIEINYDGIVSKISLDKPKIVFLYDYIRGKSYYRNSHIHNGISTLKIDQEKYYILITNKKQVTQLKIILASWYQNKFNLSEYTLHKKYRLIELESNFEWSKLKEIKT